MFRIMFADHRDELCIARVDSREIAERLAHRWAFTRGGGRYWVA